MWSVKHFRPYLYGVKFKIVTDHKPLIWLCKLSNPTSRLIRWRIQLDEYEYEVTYKQGKLNSNADALSRINIEALDNNNTNEILAITRSKTKNNLNSDSNDQTNDIAKIPSNSNNNTPTNNNTNILDSNKQHITDPEQVDRLIKEIYDSPIGAHQGIFRTYKRI